MIRIYLIGSTDPMVLFDLKEDAIEGVKKWYNSENPNAVLCMTRPNKTEIQLRLDKVSYIEIL